MGIYQDYVGSYSDLSTAYNNTPLNWDAYVDTGGVRYGSSDLNDAWEALPYETKVSYHENRGTFPTGRALWGAEHFSNYGRKERREVPKLGVTGTIVWDPETWGQDHWLSYGLNEDRILPGAKLNVTQDGTVYVADYSTIGSGARRSYNKLVSAINSASSGNYKSLMEGLKDSIGAFKFQDIAANGGLNVITAGYQRSKISPWDASTGAQPPTGGFDPTYYALKTAGGSTASQQWNAAQSSVNAGGYSLPDIDIVGRFSKDSYLQWYYTNYGKAAGDRGNEAEEAEFVKEYTEYLTDRDYQTYREQVLGLVPEGEAGTTLLEGQLSTVLNAKDKQQQQMFGALTVDSLRQALAELQKAKSQEQEFSFYQQFPQLTEITSINESIANSLLGDVGIGGILGWSGDPEKIEKEFEETIGRVTGIPSRSSAVYNWQKWFDEQLVTRYAEGITITDPNDPSITYQLDAEFAKDYIDRYLKPRFDTSRSMSEFISYMDVQQKEQNIFQTQSALDSLRQIADLRAKAYLDQVRRVSNPSLGGTASVFDPEFYLNPTGNLWDEDPKKELYETQKQKVAEDYEIAKTQGDTALVPGTDLTWNQWAYTYGLDINDQQQFAKLHYQVYGAANGYDPAKDIITLKDADDYIKTSILPAISDEKLNLGEVSFLNFVTPEEFADKMLEGISIEENQEEWEKLLETLGLSGKDMGLEEVKQYIIETFQTDAAKAIREGIKYLNEKKKTPSQAELGVEYIERPEDKKTVISENETELYKIFRNAGYQGSEDEFYDKFMTDIDRGEMQLITQGQKGLQLSGDFAGLTSEDPFEAVFSMEKLFADEDTTKKTTTDEDEEAPSYFRLFEDDTDEDYKSEAGTKILGEFTSFLKGFN